MKKLTIAAVLLAASIMPQVTFAAFVICNNTQENPCGICDVFRLVNVAVSVVVKIFIPLAATLIIVYAGFKMMLNQGNAEVAQQTKQIMLATAIGLVVVFASYAIVGAILVSMGSIQAGSALDWEPTCEE